MVFNLRQIDTCDKMYTDYIFMWREKYVGKLKIRVLFMA